MALAGERRVVASSVLHALRGDAAQRAITAWHLGWEPALEASGDTWQAAYLSALLGDPYAAVRRVAGRSLRRLPGYEDFEFDYVAAPAELGRKMHEALARWRRARTGKPDPRGAALLQDDRGSIDAEAFGRIMAQRDDRPLRIIE